MKNKEIHQKTVQEIENLIGEKRLEISQARFDVRSRQVKNHQIVKRLRKEIARLLTELKSQSSKKVQAEVNSDVK